MTRPSIGIGVIGFGWMGKAHSRSVKRIPSLFPEREFDPRLVLCCDNLRERRNEALDGFGFERVTADWQELVADPEVDAVYITAPNMLHEPLAIAAAAQNKHIFCEKPVGGTPEQTVRINSAAATSKIITGVGYNYRWAPLVQHAKALIEAGILGEITNYRGRFFTMYGSDRLGSLSWRYLLDEAGYGVSSDIMSHVVDLAHLLVGPISKVMGTMETFIAQRPLPAKNGTHYDRGTPTDPRGDVTNEDYAAAMVVFENGARGTFEVSRTIVGPESQLAFDIYGSKGALRWNLETMNELEIFLIDDDGLAPRGYTKVYSGDRYPYHGNFVPGDANCIGYEDLKVIENYEFLSAIVRGKQHAPSFANAIDYVSFQDAWLHSCRTGAWAKVERLS